MSLQHHYENDPYTLDVYLNGFGRLLNSIFNFHNHDIVSNRSHSDLIGLYNLIEKENEYVYEFNVAGIPKELIKIKIDQQRNILIINGKYENNEENNTTYFYRRCVIKHTINQNIQLPDNANSSEIVANIVNGILRITIKKSEEQQSDKIRPIIIS